MSRKIVYLINPISGTRNKSFLENIIRKENERRNIKFEIHPTNATGDYHFLSQKIRKEKVTDIVVCGGDGSVNAVGSALSGHDVNIGIIPLGSGNGLAYTANI